ncbi:lytic transglycosylase domain-containing protein [Specibacter sp. NPDC057265]|uniref:aggregation-promoting factor C-terminal-like domain-containing protein n=1 Tax=Specibacter sp. NPDC057265 TaxID=3346075 RepID=UPI003638F19E
MRTQRPSLRHLPALTAGLLLCAALAGPPAAALEEPPSGFPSWSDVERAKGDAGATAAGVEKITALLNSLDNDAEKLGTAAVAAGADYALTEAKLVAATAEVELLNAQTRQAADAAAGHKKEAVAAAVQNYKAGGAGLGVFTAVAALESPENINAMFLLQQLGEQAALKQSRATEAMTASAALEESRGKALAAQTELTLAAQAGRDAAVAAQQAVTGQLAAQQKQSSTLLAQFAVLNNTSAAVEAQYRAGKEAIAAYNQGQEAKRRAAEENARRAVEPAAPVAAATAAPKPGTAAPVAPVLPNPAPAPAPVDPAPGGGYIPVDVLLPNIPGGAVNDPAGAKNHAQSRLPAYGWAAGEFSCLNQLWERESNWRTNATNPYSGAYGIAQALPPSKYAVAGSDWLSNYRTQIEWGLGYIQNRYGSPCGAWQHSQSVGWY